LLHDVGIAGAIIAISNDIGISTPVDFKVLWPVLNPIHGQLTVQLAALWGLPLELRTVLRHHHTFEDEKRPEPLAAVTVLAETISENLGFEFAGEGSNRWLDKAFDELNIRASELRTIERTAKELLAKTLQ